MTNADHHPIDCGWRCPPHAVNLSDGIEDWASGGTCTCTMPDQRNDECPIHSGPRYVQINVPLSSQWMRNDG